MKIVDTASRLSAIDRPSAEEAGREAGLGLARSLLPRFTGANAAWHYEQGLFLQAARAAGLEWNSPDLVARVDECVAGFILPDGSIKGYRMDEYNLDQINPGKNLFALYEETGDTVYLHAIETLRGQLGNQPKTPSGGYWHKLIYPDQMWLDGLYMAEPFLARYAARFGEPSLYRDICFQFSLAEEKMRDPRSGLLFHGWDESGKQAWADRTTGCSPHFWGRSIGWFVMALTDTLEWIPPADPSAPRLRLILKRIAEAVFKFQDSFSGLWWQIVDAPERPGNYLETSVSAMLSFALAKAVRLGFLTEYPFGRVSERAYLACLGRFARRGRDGVWSLGGTCAVAGLGGDPYRDGSYEYYVSEPVKADDCKGTGPFILASIEYGMRQRP